jgi:hypothetical protein
MVYRAALYLYLIVGFFITLLGVSHACEIAADVFGSNRLLQLKPILLLLFGVMYYRLNMKLSIVTAEAASWARDREKSK